MGYGFYVIISVFCLKIKSVGIIILCFYINV